jgi:uncharacterized ferritin-like protein (DUF455 family)
MMNELRAEALKCLIMTSPTDKVIAVQQMYSDFLEEKIRLDASITLNPENQIIPGRPEFPTLVDPLQVKKRAMNTLEGRAALLHALTHIEFNAINLALDAIWRFKDMPEQYYFDWLSVAKEESIHFQLLSHHLITLGFKYGSFTGHNSLWEMVQKTSGDVLARMALVPRTMEAKGLDAVPMICKRFEQIKDHEVVNILNIILRDEVGHVSIGNRWYNYLCQQQGIDPIKTYRDLARSYKAPTLRGPFNVDARREAGFSDLELEVLLAEASS